MTPGRTFQSPLLLGTSSILVQVGVPGSTGHIVPPHGSPLGLKTLPTPVLDMRVVGVQSL
jgi:hypothetical protein